VPIHDQGYRRFAGRRDARGNAWLVIASAAVRTLLANRKFAALLLVAWAPFVYQVGKVYLSTNFPQVALLAVTAETFRSFLEYQGIFVFFVTVYAGAGLIANDRRANALQIYLSKPLTRVEYVAGKAATLVVLLLVVTWVPAMLLLLVQILSRAACSSSGRTSSSSRPSPCSRSCRCCSPPSRCSRCRRSRRAAASSA
jgi:ABC-2 type transport system permease protein